MNRDIDEIDIMCVRYVYIYIYVCIYMYVCIYICMYADVLDAYISMYTLVT